MPNKEFLETYPLHRKFDFSFPQLLTEVIFPPIHMYCEVENAEHTFNKIFDIDEVQRQGTGAVTAGQVIKVTYQCSSCHKFFRHFLIEFDKSGNWIRKMGQFPPWDITINKELEKALEGNSKIYRNGLTCESQGYGIGAFAYYRRVVEEIIDNLLIQITDLIEPAQKNKYEQALEQVKKTRITEEKIDLVKDMLPAILRPNNHNPLKLLHEFLSEGLHGKSDEECLAIAAELRKIIEFLVSQVSITKSKGLEFSEGMQRLLDKKVSRTLPGQANPE